MSRYQKLFGLVIILAIVSALVCIYKPLVRGLDIDGGIRVVMQADPKRGDDWPIEREKRIEKMNAIRKTIANRIKGVQGVREPKVVVQDDDRIVVELPGVKDPEKALNQIKKSASLEFYYLKDVQNLNNPMGKWRMESPISKEEAYIFTGPRGETIDSLKQPKEVLEQVVNTEKNPPILTGKDLMANAKANINQRQQVVIEIEFNKVGREKFATFTRSHVDDFLAVFFDGKLLTAPKINEAIPSGKAEVSGFQSLGEAKRTAEFLNAGALPVPLKVIAKDTVEPTLGMETVHKVVFAGIAGLILVVLFMIVYYKLPGIIASIALGLYALFVIAVFKLLGATMSLAGVAALIISIGMAVDANILIFERLKEELRSGKTLRASIDAGFNRAFTAIFDSNMCTAITCAILMWYGSSSVQSFALTLLVGVVISMFTAITVTRTFLHMLVGAEWAQNPNLYGLGTSWLHRVNANIVGKRNYFFALSAILIIPGLVVLGMYGLKPGIEFKSGTSVQASFTQKVELAQVRDIVSKYSEANEVQLNKSKDVAYIVTLPLNEAKETALRNDLNNTLGLTDGKFSSVSSVEPTISRELTVNAFWAVLIASLGIVLYLTGRFAIGGLSAGLKYGVCAVLALIHDSAFILGLFAILGKFAGWEVDSLFVTAILTIIGFSVHDTIVVFDRIRENLRHRERGESFEQLANKSILQTLSRSINTSMTVVMTLAALIVLGGPLLRHFYIALLAGIIIGTYSSIFNATPLVIVWENIASKTGAEPKKKTFEDKALVEKPIAGVSEIPGEAGEQIAKADESVEAGAQAARIKRKTTKKKRY
ncbi:protein translocase subunit SecD [bacterium]|nr:protein translocase subunit SecD [bacterium]